MNRLQACTFKLFILVVTFGSSLGSQKYNSYVENYAVAHADKPELVAQFLSNFSSSNAGEGSFFFGLYYLGSFGARVDYKAANENFYQSCKIGFGLGCKALADSYMAGHGVPKSHSLAKIYYQRGAILGYGPAQLNVAFMYKNGEGCIQDIKKACYWFKEAFSKEEMSPLINVINSKMTQLKCAENCD
jgi:TPR repeat protein